MTHHWCNIIGAFFLLSAAPAWHGARQAGEVALLQRDYRHASDSFRAALDQAPSSERALLWERMAVAALRDQDHKSAFALYLKALESAERLPEIEEEELYQEALALYLAGQSEEICLRYGGSACHGPLKMVVALAYADRGLFEEFFDRFLLAYQRSPDHFLALKTRAILRLKLAEYGGSEAEVRELQRTALDLLRRVVARYPADSESYRLIVELAPELTLATVTELLANRVAIPRLDLGFYLDRLLALGAFDLAQKLVARGREQYGYSRSLDRAEETLDKRVAEK